MAVSLLDQTLLAPNSGFIGFLPNWFYYPLAEYVENIPEASVEAVLEEAIRICKERNKGETPH